VTLENALSLSNRLLLDYMEGWNRRDPDQFSSCLHFPSLRLNGNNMIQIFQSRDDISSMFQKLAATEDYIQSKWIEAKIIQASDQKIHVSCAFVREHNDKKTSGPFHSLYIITLEQDRWGVKLRSSFHG